jgi:hypothetical protein
MPKSLYDKIGDRAVEMRRTRSALTRMVLEQYFERRKGEDRP